MSLTCVILASISQTYGVMTMDTTMMILLPLQMLLGEQLESGEWFVKKVTNSHDDNSNRIWTRITRKASIKKEVQANLGIILK